MLKITDQSILIIKDIGIKAKIDIKKTTNIDELEIIRIKYLGKQGQLTKQIITLRHYSHAAKATIGKIINQVKNEIQQTLICHKNILQEIEINKQLNIEYLDVSLPGRRMENGGLHPITNTITDIEEFFKKMGFSIVDGQEIEDDYHNFNSLNISAYHPTRTDHDTFWFDSNRLLRTQTSGIQIRTMKERKPPIRIISSGKVYRRDYNRTHTPMFHQIEGLIVDYNISFANLKGMLYNFLYIFFEKNIHIRFRPSYFPFTEPSAEIDIKISNNNWLEILGCGMIHPNVLCNVNIDPKKYSGLAFGMGIERLAMLRYNIGDLRIFFENDLRVLKQFKQSESR